MQFRFAWGEMSHCHQTTRALMSVWFQHTQNDGMHRTLMHSCALQPIIERSADPRSSLSLAAQPRAPACTKNTKCPQGEPAPIGTNASSWSHYRATIHIKVSKLKALGVCCGRLKRQWPASCWHLQSVLPECVILHTPAACDALGNMIIVSNDLCKVWCFCKPPWA